MNHKILIIPILLFGMITAGCLGNTIIPEEDNTLPIPSEWRLDSIATQEPEEIVYPEEIQVLSFLANGTGEYNTTTSIDNQHNSISIPITYTYNITHMNIISTDDGITSNNTYTYTYTPEGKPRGTLTLIPAELELTDITNGTVYTYMEW